MIKIPLSSLVYMALLLFAFSGCEKDKDIVTYDNLDVSQLKNFENDSKDSIISRIISQHQEGSHTTETENYESHYDVVGTDKDGNNVSGYADIEGKQGKGTLENEMGDEIEVNVEWIDNGKLKAEDQEGNTWELVVE